jgi:hypothetical protein
MVILTGEKFKTRTFCPANQNWIRREHHESNTTIKLIIVKFRAKIFPLSRSRCLQSANHRIYHSINYLPTPNPGKVSVRDLERGDAVDTAP